MTLHQLFDLSTIEHRHLLLAYTLVALTQLIFLVLTLRSMRRANSSSAAPFGTPGADQRPPRS